MDNKTAPNVSYYSIGGVSSSVDTLVLGGNSVLRMNICTVKPVHRKFVNGDAKDPVALPLVFCKASCPSNN